MKKPKLEKIPQLKNSLNEISSSFGLKTKKLKYKVEVVRITKNNELPSIPKIALCAKQEMSVLCGGESFSRPTRPSVRRVHLKCIQI